MYAVIETGGKQHKVEKGMVLSVDLLKDDVGKKITFENVLLYVDGDKVEAVSYTHLTLPTSYAV